MGNILGIAGGQAAINTASGFAGQLMGRIFGPRDRANQLKQQEALNEQAYDINNRMAEANYEREMRKWNETNYSAQMEQLNKAGLNPGLLYGMSGGGGATASAAPGQGVGAGQAESSRQGMGIMPIDMMAIQTAKAQQELIKAQTEKTKAETANVPLTGENIKSDTALKNTNNEIQKIQKEIQENSKLDQTAQIQSLASKAAEEVDIAQHQKNILSAEADLAIQTAKEKLITLQLQNDNARKNLELTDAQIDKIATELSIAKDQLEINKILAQYQGVDKVTGSLLVKILEKLGIK